MLLRAEHDDDPDATQVAFDAVLYDLVVIGEAVNALPTYLTDTEPDVPWRDAVHLRNFQSHEYFRVRADVVRQTIDVPLAELRARPNDCSTHKNKAANKPAPNAPDAFAVRHAAMAPSDIQPHQTGVALTNSAPPARAERNLRI